MKKMNGYRLQYWLYAMFNKNFGRDVQLKRDPLHGMYSVNRHGFTAHGRNTTTADYMFAVMVRRLRECGFRDDIARGYAIVPGSRAQLVKYRQVGKQVETINVTLTIREVAFNYERAPKFVDVWSAVYRSAAK